MWPTKIKQRIRPEKKCGVYGRGGTTAGGLWLTALTLFRSFALTHSLCVARSLSFSSVYPRFDGQGSAAVVQACFGVKVDVKVVFRGLGLLGFMVKTGAIGVDCGGDEDGWRWMAHNLGFRGWWASQVWGLWNSGSGVLGFDWLKFWGLGEQGILQSSYSKIRYFYK
ncbi:hypothetical protein Ancab_003046 [Ancistrocladus abbreviatus]